MSTIDNSTPEFNPLLISLTTKNFSNICKRLVEHLSKNHDANLTHTQARTAMAKALGFDSPNALDALLREADSKSKDARASGSGSSSQEAPEGSNNDQKGRMLREQELRTLLREPIARDAKDTAGNLANLMLSLLAQVHPAKLSAADKAAIKRIYPQATPALMNSRAMSHEGVVTALALAVQTGRIAIDYYPPSDSSSAIARDNLLDAKVGPTFVSALTKVFEVAVKNGMSPFGASTILILTGGAVGLQHGVAWSSVVRTLLEAVDLMVKRGLGRDVDAEAEEHAIRAVMAQMGISRKEAQKYADFVKNNPDFR